MNFLKRIFTGEPDDLASADSHIRPFSTLSASEMEVHLGIDRYGDFQLTGAVRPSYDLKVIPQQGYRRDSFHDRESGGNVPMLTAAASDEILFELFMDLLDPLGTVVDMVLETSHHCGVGQHQDHYREHIDMPVLKSILWDHENLLTDDGCTGIAVLNPNIPMEVQFDEHKLLIIYGQDLGAFESILTKYRIVCDEEVKFITEGEHVHASREEYAEDFEILKRQLGMETSFGTCR